MVKSYVINIKKETNLIANQIYKKLSYTNGWLVETKDYKKECREVAKRIATKIEKKCNQAILEHFEKQLNEYCNNRDALTDSGFATESGVKYHDNVINYLETEIKRLKK